MLEAYILYARPWRDSSLLLDVLLRDDGRQRVLARGARRPGRRGGSGGCQPFCPLLVTLRGRSELKTVASLEPRGSAWPLAGAALLAGLYANELLLRALSESAPCGGVFTAYEELLQALAQPQADLEPPLRAFELTLLNELGYGLDFLHDAVSGEAVRAAASYRWVPQCGFVEVGPVAVAGEAVVPGGALLLLAGGQFDEPLVRRVAKQVLRQALREVIGERPLRSRELFRRGRLAGEPGDGLTPGPRMA